MGWKQFFKKTFEDECVNGTFWGDLAPHTLNIDSESYYTVGWVGSPIGWLFSPKVQHPQGVKTRIRIVYFFYADANTVGSASLGIVFYKDGDTAKDPDGHDLHGVSHSLDIGVANNFAERHEFVMEYDGTNKIAWYVDGNKIDETTIELPLVSFKVAVAVNEAINGEIGILVHEVVGEYYDQWEDWINSIVGMMQWILPLMLVMMFVPMLVSVFRTEGKKEEERKIIVVPG